MNLQPIQAGPGAETFLFSAIQSEAQSTAPLPAMAAIAVAIGGLEQRGSGPAHLRDLESNLMDVLTGMERNPGVEAAAEDLYRAAAAFVRAERDPTATPGPRLVRLLREALGRLQDRIFAANGMITAA